jgi:hypothetical protein|tara:strand:- start:14 stop:163 length:150 start_codon:yes stop_codon:yes gene_type:complete
MKTQRTDLKKDIKVLEQLLQEATTQNNVSAEREIYRKIDYIKNLLIHMS